MSCSRCTSTRFLPVRYGAIPGGRRSAAIQNCALCGAARVIGR